jgi:NlpC/P60 family protein
MRPAFKFATAYFCLGAALAGRAENARPRVDAAPSLLSAEQGQTLADFASRSGPAIWPKPDCSHLVHVLYSRAGLNYSYEGSRVLHRGIADFARVKKPQPGDLAVWLGHVGIVLSPEDKTFLSSVRSGIIIESWDNDYWSARGRPRFFRYIVGPEADLTLLASLAPQRGRESASTRSSPAPQAEARINTEADEPQAPAISPSANEDHDLPSAVAVVRQRGKPDKQNVAAAFRQAGFERARQLIEGGPFDPARPVSIVDRVQVTRIKIRHDQGTIHLKLTETLILDHGRAVPGNMVERELALDRRDGVWVISDSQQRLYLPREQAIDVLEHQLQLALQNDSSRVDKHAMVRALNFLYDREQFLPAQAEARPR